jgi:cell division protein FtsQ
LLGYLVTMLWIVGDKSEEVRVDAISVHISDNTNNKFITESDVRESIERENVNLIGTLMDSVNIHLLEDLITHNNKSISRAEVYRTIYGEIGVNVEQRRPIMRIINPNGDSYYVDDNGQVMPLSKKYTAHVIVVNGHLNEPYMDHVGENLKRQQLKSDNANGELLPDLFKLVHFINSSRFWKAQIEQIYINSKGDIELVPRVGNHTIILGSIDDMREKFENLEAFYEQGLSKYGWNKYKTINLKFKNQIVCTKRI